nr:hypothetical protein [Nocardia vinacea]
MVEDGLFDLSSREIGQIALAVLPSPTQEIAVPAAVVALGLGVDHAGCASSAVAPITEKVTLQVVLQNPITLAQTTAHIHDVLYAVEQLLGDDRLMSAGVKLALILDPAGVVRVLQHLMETLEGHWPFRPFADWSCSQPQVGHGRFE